MEIRFATPQDVPGILSLLRQVGQVHAKGRPDIFRNNAQKFSASQVIAMLDSPENPIFIAAENNRVLGYGFCTIKTFPNNPVIDDHRELYVEDLCTDENCRGQGVGSAIYTAIRKYAKMRKCHSITLNVWNFNTSAVAFYEGKGLKPRNTVMEELLEDGAC